MLLEGSCHCGAVRFSLESDSPSPYLRCYCTVCRKVAGGGGYAINLGGDFGTLKIKGEAELGRYHKVNRNPQTGEKEKAAGHRCFCRKCGTALWNYDPGWPDLVHPFASAIDTSLPPPPESTHMMLGSKANWVVADIREADSSFDEYPDESLADWHRRQGLS
jgi:hypothetical protein